MWYFAYGSNLNPKKLTERHDIEFSEVKPAVLKNYRLAFNMKAIPGIEPTMASVEKEQGREVHGVLIKLTDISFNNLIESEGGQKYYKVHKNLIYDYEGISTEASFFISKDHYKLDEDLRPSARYLNLIREGAWFWKLEPSWCKMLDSYPSHTSSFIMRSYLKPWAETFIDFLHKRKLHSVVRFIMEKVVWSASLPFGLRQCFMMIFLFPCIAFGFFLSLVSSKDKKRNVHTTNFGNRIIAIEPEQIDIAVENAVIVMKEDPTWVKIFPVEKKRVTALKILFKLIFNYALKYGRILTTEDYKSSSVWISPGNFPLSKSKLFLLGAWKIPFLIPLAGMSKLTKLQKMLDKAHKENMNDSHWWFYLITVHPDARGRGVAKALIENILWQADSEKKTCYLNTFSTVNVKIFNKFGFEKIEQDYMNCDLTFYPMIRSVSE